MDNKDLPDEKKFDKNKVVIVTFLASVFIIIAIACKAGSSQNSAQLNKSNTVNSTSIANTKAIDTIYNPTTEEKAVLKKSYESFEGHDYTVFSDLDKEYDSMSEDKRQSIKTDIERLRKEKTAYNEECKKQSEQNKQLYADFSKEIETNYPDMKVNTISGRDDKKIIDIDMNLLHNINETEEKCAELAIMKETRMKEVGIKYIVIFVKDKNGEQHGMVTFKLDQGEYKPVVNSLE